MKHLFKTLSLALLLSVSTLANAELEKGSNQRENIHINHKVEIGIHTGISNIKAHELVYIGSYKLSELIWDSKNVFMVGADASIGLGTSWDIKFNAGFSTNVSKGNSTMDDYDWMFVGADWSDWSHHENTRLQRALTIDANLSASIYSNNDNSINVEARIGFKRDQFKWGAVGGSFIYSWFGFRDVAGTFANIPVITYQQTVNTPYAGIGFDWTEDWLTLSVDLIGSPFVSAEAVDDHILRTILFTDKFKNGKMIGGKVNFTYRSSENLAFNLFFDFQNYFENRGDTSAVNYVTGATSFNPDIAGMTLAHHTFGLGARYSF